MGKESKVNARQGRGMDGASQYKAGKGKRESKERGKGRGKHGKESKE